ncbi:DUF3153 domain-containing protein [Desulfuribacillus alkaliarsenatis]|uniref:DUF3153 domain-containing protein n=1 Tax=Desulfuribacillus alkaliarsenatis TaxID=766136 RepID=A0A1E5G1D6_9FIRM|nr:DUF3153 domain-containing protein [Desulfuribacillus alkaliarsenatis]OEF96729.1 hypothetical protein BHF68_06550 [Desulfuribacillus alkaliarsenatis]
MGKHHLRRMGIIVILLLVALVATGCAEGAFHITINADGSADLDYKLGVHRSTLGLLALAGDNLVLDLRRGAKQEGYIVSSYTTDQFSGLQLRKTLETLDDASFDFDMFEIKLPFIGEATEQQVTVNEPMLTVRERMFFTTYNASGNIDLSAIDINLPSQLSQLGALAIEQINLEFILTLPMQPTKHNADEVRDNGYTLVWDIKPGKNNEIEVTARLPNVNRILLLIALIIISTVIGFIYYRFSVTSGRHM